MSKIIKEITPFLYFVVLYSFIIMAYMFPILKKIVNKILPD